MRENEVLDAVVHESLHSTQTPSGYFSGTTVIEPDCNEVTQTHSEVVNRVSVTDESNG